MDKRVVKSEKMWEMIEELVPFRLDAILQAACVAVLLIHSQDVHMSSWSFEHTSMKSSPADTRGLDRRRTADYKDVVIIQTRSGRRCLKRVDSESNRYTDLIYI